MANSLNRERQSLSNTALAYLALTFANLEPAASWPARCWAS